MTPPRSQTTDSTEPRTTGRTGLTRRSVVRAGGHAAWAVPAITIVSAAPALAASGVADLTGGVAIGNVTYDDTNVYFPVVIVNRNTQASTGLQLTVVVELREVNEWGASPTATSTISTAPGAGTVSTTNTKRYSFSLLATTQVPGSGTRGGSLSTMITVNHGSGVPPLVNAPYTAYVSVTAAPGGGGASGFGEKYT